MSKLTTVIIEVNGFSFAVDYVYCPASYGFRPPGERFPVEPDEPCTIEIENIALVPRYVSMAELYKKFPCYEDLETEVIAAIFQQIYKRGES